MVVNYICLTRLVAWGESSRTCSHSHLPPWYVRPHRSPSGVRRRLDAGRAESSRSSARPLSAEGGGPDVDPGASRPSAGEHLGAGADARAGALHEPAVRRSGSQRAEGRWRQALATLLPNARAQASATHDFLNPDT